MNHEEDELIYKAKKIMSLALKLPKINKNYGCLDLTARINLATKILQIDHIAELNIALCEIDQTILDLVITKQHQKKFFQN